MEQALQQWQGRRYNPPAKYNQSAETQKLRIKKELSFQPKKKKELSVQWAAEPEIKEEIHRTDKGQSQQFDSLTTKRKTKTAREDTKTKLSSNGAFR